MTGGQGWSLTPADEPKPQPKTNPDSPKPHVRMERRLGKPVTVVLGLHTYGRDRLERMARELKASLGAGGTVKNGTIEIQGDHVERVRAWLISERRGHFRI